MLERKCKWRNVFIDWVSKLLKEKQKTFDLVGKEITIVLGKDLGKVPYMLL